MYKLDFSFHVIAVSLSVNFADFRVILLSIYNETKEKNYEENKKRKKDASIYKKHIFLYSSLLLHFF